MVEALGELYAAGMPRGADDMANLATVIYNESGGDPTIKNLGDSNAAKGTPSFGLMQTVAPTFAQWALPSHRDAADPVGQIIAGARYAQAAYGSIATIPGVVSLAHSGPYLPY